MSASNFCDVCQCRVPGGGRERDAHIRGKAHCRKAGLRTEAVLLSAHRDRNGVSVSSQETGLDFGVVEPGRVSRAFKSFVLKATTETADFMVLEPRWTSSSLSVRADTLCVKFLTCSSRLLTDYLCHPAAFRVDSKVIPTSGEAATFGLLCACASPKLVHIEIRWRLDSLVYRTISSSPSLERSRQLSEIQPIIRCYFQRLPMSHAGGPTVRK